MNSPKWVYRRMRWSAFWSGFQLPEIGLSNLVDDKGTVTPLITDKLCLPPYYGPTDHDDVTPLLTLVQQMDPRIVLELGTAHGSTTANMCTVSHARVYTVNALPEQIDGALISFVLGREEIGETYRNCGFSERVTQIYENTWQLDLTRYLPAASVDLAIIDACHDVDFVINDFMCVLPLLHSRSIVLFHDVHPSLKEHLRSSYIACMYLRKMGFNIKHLQNTWWGVWEAEDGAPTLPLTVQLVNALDNKLLKMRSRTPTEDAVIIHWLSQVVTKRPN